MPGYGSISKMENGNPYCCPGCGRLRQGGHQLAARCTQRACTAFVRPRSQCMKPLLLPRRRRFAKAGANWLHVTIVQARSLGAPEVIMSEFAVKKFKAALLQLYRL